jgi:hypothetical protein
MYEPTSPLQMQQGGGNLQQQQMMQQPMVQMQQPMMQPMMMMPHPMMMMPQPMMQPTMMSMQPTQPTSATGANAAELIEAQLHPPTVTESASVSILDVAPEVKPAESSSASSESSEGKRVIKLS